ncbi:hypothetical protein WR25_12705 isoform C [Diploscapter pachys]|uniref:3-phosphoinositide-dependent protein kinase 1 n=2 Tax=Diploscapter pachys TaxID=2018661 RepID=A0A2A2LLF6_9BILA|nr:hypothetical protein WR25_12705 isoform C [Diploscapter pachys]
MDSVMRIWRSLGSVIEFRKKSKHRNKDGTCTQCQNGTVCTSSKHSCSGSTAAGKLDLWLNEQRQNLNGKFDITDASLNDIQFIRSIGDGSFSTVYKAKDVKRNLIIAMKIIQRTHIERHDKVAAIERERNILHYLTYEKGGNCFVPSLYATFQNDSYIFIGTSFAEKGDMAGALKFFGFFDVATTKFFVAEIIAALEFIHGCGIIHRDLKPANILIKEDSHIMITDFGSANITKDMPIIFNNSPKSSSNGTKQIVNNDKSSDDQLSLTMAENDESGKENHINSESQSSTSSFEKDNENDENEATERQRRSTFVGTAQYVSPEMLNGEEINEGVDIWALGCIIYQCLCGQAPFRAVNNYHLMKKIQSLNYKFPHDFDAQAQDCVEKILVVDASKRLGVVSLQELKQHPLFEGIDWSKSLQTVPQRLIDYTPKAGPDPDPKDLELGFNEKIMQNIMNMERSDGTDELGLMRNVDFEKFLPNGVSDDDHEHLTKLLNAKKVAAIREKKLEKQRREHPYHKFVNDNLIIKAGLLDKKRGLFAKRRMFLLTEGPHFYYVDPAEMCLKGEVPWSPCMNIEATSFRTIQIQTPDRVYFLFDNDRRSVEWVQTLNKVKTTYAETIKKVYDKAILEDNFETIYGKKRSEKVYFK